jgi:thioesterase domain-containing protein/acyl carrier protein
MMPAIFVPIAALPRTVNGKLDRDALPKAPRFVRHSSQTDQRGPANAMETILLRLFEDLLLVGPIGVNDNFLELGGNSLLAAQLAMRIEKETGHSVPTATLFQAPTVEQLALKLENRTYTHAWSRIVELRQGNGSAAEPLFCIHWLDAKLVTFYKIASCLRDDRPVYGLQPGGPVEHESAFPTIAEMAAIYLREIQAFHPRGPYHLAGSCLGGVVAFEIAQQLVAAGQQVELLVMIDASMPGPLQYLHQRPHFPALLDGYFGELLLSPSAALKRWTLESASRISARLRVSNSLTRSKDYFKRVSRHAEASYKPQPYAGKVTLLICSDAPFRAYEDSRLAWGSVARGGLEVHVVPGNHTTMEQEPNLRVIGEHLQRCLDRLRDR